MKRFLALLAFVLVAVSAQAASSVLLPQAVPVGRTPGAVVRDVHVFGSQTGATPRAPLVTDGAGSLYGTTETGGAYNLGTVFRLTTAGQLTVLHSFGPVQADGGTPIGALVLAPDGFLYGVTSAGGTTGDGTIFRLDPATLAFTTLASFDAATTGNEPTGGFATDGRGNFYGTTQSGTQDGTMTTGQGTLFVYQAGTGTLAPLVNFNDVGAEYSITPLLYAPDGKLYGTSGFGGPLGDGTLFQFNPATGQFTTLISFGQDLGGDPVGPPTVDAQGNFYVTTQEGGANRGGALYTFTVDATTNPPTATPRLLYSFDDSGTIDASFSPSSSLTLGFDGNLYGTSTDGGASFSGTFFRLRLNAPDGNGNAATLDTLYALPYAMGNYANTPLLAGAAGNFYGTNYDGGPNETGQVFELSPVAGSTPLQYGQVDLYDFPAPDGNDAATALTLGRDGNLYGTTLAGAGPSGGTGSSGSVFVYNPRTGATTTLHAFPTGTDDGSRPQGKLVETSPGVFYGTTQFGGGQGGYGTLYRLNTATDPATGAISAAVTVLYAFSPYSNNVGSEPFAGLALGPDGRLYGTTVYNGTSGDATLFVYDPAANTVTALATVPGVNGEVPAAELTLGGDGNFYGTTTNGYGVGGYGTLFQFNPVTNALTTLASFNGQNGASPAGALIQGTDGTFYGVTQSGGDYDDGTLFQFTPATGALLTLLSFNGTTGVQPAGTLVQAPDGNFYGTTHTGGTTNDGTAFQYNPNTGAFAVLHSFDGYSGYYPGAGLTLAPDGSFYGTTAGSDEGEFGFTASRRAATAARSVAKPAAQAVPDAAVYGAIYQLTVAPAITSTSFAVGTLGVPFRDQVAATFQPTSFAASGLPPGLTLDAATGVISGTPGATGVFPVTLTATNAGGSGSAVLAIDILAQAPVITAPAATAVRGQPFTYQITATGSPTSFAATGLPAGLTLNAATGLISGVPTATGSFGVALDATNSGGSGTATLALMVNVTAAITPVISSPLTAAAQVGTAFQYQIAATNVPVSYGASGLPAGLVVNEQTGLISGTPTASGAFTVILLATNATGSGTAALALTVGPAATPTITAAATVPVAHADAGTPGVFTVTISAPPTTKLIVRYTLKGSAVNGTDYVFLTGKAKIKPGHTTTSVQVVPRGDLDGAASKTVKLILTSGSGFTVGTTAAPKIKIKP